MFVPKVDANSDLIVYSFIQDLSGIDFNIQEVFYANNESNTWSLSLQEDTWVLPRKSSIE
jgi:hypothetical protein